MDAETSGDDVTAEVEVKETEHQIMVTDGYTMHQADNEDIYETREVILEDFIIENDGSERVVYIVQPKPGDIGGVEYAVVDDIQTGLHVTEVDVASSSSVLEVGTNYAHIGDAIGNTIAGSSLSATAVTMDEAVSTIMLGTHLEVNNCAATGNQVINSKAADPLNMEQLIYYQSAGHAEVVHSADQSITTVCVKTRKTPSTGDKGEVTNNAELNKEQEVSYLFCCQFCGDPLATIAELRKHLHDHHNVDEDDEISLYDHEEENEDEEDMVVNLPSCSQCSKIFLNEEDLTEHSKQCKVSALEYSEVSNCLSVDSSRKICEETISRQHKCQECSMSFHLRSDLASHIDEGHNTMSDGAMYSKCPYCPRLYRYQWHRKSLTRHIKTDHPGLEFKAVFENMEVILEGSDDFAKIRNLKKANNQQEWVQPYNCPVCGLECSFRKNLLRHIKNDHSDMVTGKTEAEIEVMFDIQGRIRRTKDSLNRKNVELFSCSYCSKEFMWSKSLKRHMIDSHMLAVDNKAKTVRRTKDAVEKEKLFYCKFCQKSFMHEKTLKRHIWDCHRAEAGDNINDIFNMSGNGTRQSKEDKGKYWFKCLYCKQVSKYACSIRTHIIRKHEDECGDLNVKTLKLPLVLANSKNFAVRSLDMRPPEEKYDDGSVVFKCPLCNYMTKNRSNLARHLTSKVHNNAFTWDDLKTIKLTTFRVTVDADAEDDHITEDEPDALQENDDKSETVKNLMLKIAERKKIVLNKNRNDSGENGSIKEKTIDESKRESVKNEQEMNEESIFQTKSSYEEARNDETILITCTACGMKFSEYPKLIDHCRNHVNVKVSFKCTNCDETSINFEGLKEHHKRIHIDIPFCGSLIKNVVVEYVDEEIPQQLKTFDCPYCDLILSKSELLSKHILLNHDTRVESVSIKAERRDEDDTVSPAFSCIGNASKVTTGFMCMFCACIFQTVLDIVKHMHVVHPDVEKSDKQGKKSKRKRKKVDDKLDADDYSSKPKSARNKNSLTPGRYDSGMQNDDESVTTRLSGENRCPHCDFTCKRASALNFHINFNHAKIKQEPMEIESPKTKKKESNAIDTLNRKEKQIKDKDELMEIKSPNKRKKEMDSSKKKEKQFKDKQELMEIESPQKKKTEGKEIDTPKMKEKQIKYKSPVHKNQENNDNIMETRTAEDERKTHCHGTRASMTNTSSKHMDGTNNNLSKKIKEDGNKSKSENKISKNQNNNNLDTEFCSLPVAGGKEAKRSTSYVFQEKVIDKNTNTSIGKSKLSVLGTKQDIVKNVSLRDETKLDTNTATVTIDKSKGEDNILIDDLDIFGADDDQDVDYMPTDDEEEMNEAKSNVNANTGFKLPSALTPSRKLRCPHCDTREFTSVRFLEKHVKKEHPEKWDSFSIQEAESSAFGETGVKIENNKSNKLSTCTYCKHQFQSKYAVMQHVKKAHRKVLEVKLKLDRKVNNVGKKVGNSDKTMPDSENENEISDGRKMKSHKYKCVNCTSYFDSKLDVLKHSKIAHPDNDEIEVDNIPLANSCSLSSGDFHSLCPYCNFSSKWKRCTIRHVKIRHPEKKDFTADLIIGQKRIGKKKKATETGIFSCPYCGIVNKWKKSIVRHIRTAHPDKSDNVELQCIVPSSEASNQDQNLRSRDRRTSKKQCLLCSFTCSFMRILKTHYAFKHPGEEEIRFKYVFQEDGSSTAAAKSGAGPECVYRCHLCNVGYYWKKSLVYHYKVHHPEMVDVFMTLDKMVDIIDGAVTTVGEESTVQDTATSCTDCDAVTLSTWATWAHGRMKHNSRLLHAPRRNTCPVCRVSFPSRTTLLCHKLYRHRRKKRCVKSRSLGCQHPGCNYRCKLGTKLKLHYNRVHQCGVGDQKPDAGVNDQNVPHLHHCEVCSQTFANETGLSEHLLLEHVQKLMRGSKYRKFTCNKCPMTFDRPSERNKHLTEKHSESAEICDQCGSLFPSVKQLQWHKRLHERTSEQMQICEHCGVTLAKKSVARHYMFKHQDMLTCNCSTCSASTDSPSPIKCQFCERNFCKKLLLQAHYRWQHGHMSKYNCKQCPQSFSKLRQRNRHVHECHRKKNSAFLYRCKLCPDTFTTANLKNIHVHDVHGEQYDLENILNPDQPITSQYTDTEPMKIEEGNQDDPTTHIIHIGQDQGVQYLPKLSDVSLSAVIKELQIIDDKNTKYPFKCLLCGRNFGKSKYIKLHIRRNHVKDEDQPYRCKVCGSGFVRLTEFRKHSRSHSGFRPYKCKVCTKAFKQQANLMEHMNIHKDTKDFMCAICKRTFRQRGAMNSHIPHHDTLKPFKCAFCNKGYTTRGELSRHMQRYDEDSSNTRQERSFLCHICEETFSHFPMLLRHIEQHNPDKPFHCQACPMKFTSFISMYNHKLKVGHFLVSEIEDEIDSNEKSVRKVRNMSRDNRQAVQSLQLTNHQTSTQQQLEDGVSVHDSIFSSQTEVFNVDQSKSIEVVIEEVGSNDFVYTSNGRNENEELLSIAKQLTELSSYTELSTTEMATSTILKEEDEIIKGMLDADSDLLASIGKQSTTQKWTTDETWEQGQTKSAVTDGVSNTALYSNDSEEGETAAASIKVSGATSENMNLTIPGNMPELASLIAQNSHIQKNEAITAYQSMDGSVIYVCMTPEQVVKHSEEIYETNNSDQSAKMDKVKKNIGEYKVLADVGDMETSHSSDTTNIVMCPSDDTEVIQVAETLHVELITSDVRVNESDHSNVQLIQQESDHVNGVEQVHGVEHLQGVDHAQGVEQVQEVDKVHGVVQVQEVEQVQGVDQVHGVEQMQAVDQVHGVEQVQGVDHVQGVEQVHGDDYVYEQNIVEQVHGVEQMVIVEQVHGVEQMDVVEQVHGVDHVHGVEQMDVVEQVHGVDHMHGVEQMDIVEQVHGVDQMDVVEQEHGVDHVHGVEHVYGVEDERHRVEQVHGVDHVYEQHIVEQVRGVEQHIVEQVHIDGHVQGVEHVYEVEQQHIVEQTQEVDHVHRVDHVYGDEQLHRVGQVQGVKPIQEIDNAQRVEEQVHGVENMPEAEQKLEVQSSVEEYDDGITNVVEYENDEKTFIKDLWSYTYATTEEETGSLTIQSKTFKYAFNLEGKMFRCLECELVHKTLQSLQAHMKRHMPKELRSFECKYCSKRFVTNTELKCHVRKHTGERPFGCTYCDKKFIQSGHLQDHVKIHLGKKPYQCHDCDAAFTTKSLMTSHWKRHHNKEREIFECFECNKKFHDEATLKTHIGFKHSSVFGPRKEKSNNIGNTCQYQCHICGCLIEKKKSYNEHMNKHKSPEDDSTNWICEVCGEACKSQRFLNEHFLKVHSDETPEICEYCGHSFKLKRELQAHIKKRHRPVYKGTGKKAQFPCQVCGRVFACKGALGYHGGVSEACRLGLIPDKK